MASLIELSIPVPSRPSTRPPAPIFPEFIDQLKHCHQASETLKIIYFLKAHHASYQYSDKNSNTDTNTKTNTDTNSNTKTETNKERSWDTYGVIYFWKGDDKRILSMICVRQGPSNTNTNPMKRNVQAKKNCIQIFSVWKDHSVNYQSTKVACSTFS